MLLFRRSLRFGVRVVAGDERSASDWDGAPIKSPASIEVTATIHPACRFTSSRLSLLIMPAQREQDSPSKLFSLLSPREEEVINNVVPIQLLDPGMVLNPTPCQDNIDLLDLGIKRINKDLNMEQLVPADSYKTVPLVPPAKYAQVSFCVM